MGSKILTGHRWGWQPPLVFQAWYHARQVNRWLIDCLAAAAYLLSRLIDWLLVRRCLLSRSIDWLIDGLHDWIFVTFFFTYIDRIPFSASFLMVKFCSQHAVNFFAFCQSSPRPPSPFPPQEHAPTLPVDLVDSHPDIPARNTATAAWPTPRREFWDWFRSAVLPRLGNRTTRCRVPATRTGRCEDRVYWRRKWLCWGPDINGRVRCTDQTASSWSRRRESGAKYPHRIWVGSRGSRLLRPVLKQKKWIS